MGHKSGLKKVGAQGLIPALTKKEIDKSFAEGQTIELSRLAQAHTGTAIETLVEVMGDLDATAGSRVSAATRILEFAHGRAAQTVNQKSDSGGLTINILRMSDGETHREVIDAVNVAREMLESSKP